MIHVYAHYRARADMTERHNICNFKNSLLTLGEANQSFVEKETHTY